MRESLNNIFDYDIFIKGTFVNLVVLTEEIVEKTNWYNWFNDEDTTANMQQHYFPNTKAKQLEFFKSEIEKSDTKLQLGIVLADNNLYCGVISLNNIVIARSVSSVVRRSSMGVPSLLLNKIMSFLLKGSESIGN